MCKNRKRSHKESFRASSLNKVHKRDFMKRILTAQRFFKKLFPFLYLYSRSDLWNYWTAKSSASKAGIFVIETMTHLLGDCEERRCTLEKGIMSAVLPSRGSHWKPCDLDTLRHKKAIQGWAWPLVYWWFCTCNAHEKAAASRASASLTTSSPLPLEGASSSVCHKQSFACVFSRGCLWQTFLQPNRRHFEQILSPEGL